MAHNQSESGRTEQIISQFFVKALHAILAARVPRLALPPDQASGAEARSRRRERWFNLALGELPPALESPGIWHQGVMEPMIVDVILSPRDGNEAEVVIERWTAQCEPPSPWATAPLSPVRGGGDGSSSSSSHYRKTYKKSIVLLRSIYCLLRFLPAYRVFRLLYSSDQSYNYDISYRASSFAEHFSREEEKRFSLYSFSPVETQLGHLSVTVLYRPTPSDLNLEVCSLFPPLIITDYVGSPATETMRAFPASSLQKVTRPISFPPRGVRTSMVPLYQRPHSWNHAPMAHHPLKMSPDAVADQRLSPPDYFSGQRIAVHRQISHRKGNFSLEEYRLSPPYLHSTSPSPPAHVSNAFQSRLRSETAPVTIPQSLTGRNQFHRSPNSSDPTRTMLPPPSPVISRVDNSLEESPSSRSFRKLEALIKMGDLHSHLYTASKVLKDAKDDSGRFSSVFSSSGSPRLVFSRSSSRKSILDDLEDCEFSYPFAVDDVDSSEFQNRNSDGKEASDSSQTSASAHRSQDAAVGVLVHMLRTAPPLRQDHGYSSQTSKSEAIPETSASSYFKSRKKSDALEELQSYREMKQVLISQSRMELLDSKSQTNLDSGS
ncbi:hypothetical protein AXF42_Ash020907 [Apostasia shenzhenica]|uniref:Autophagy-related protein 13 N-terminal domain-containing protein n=1 Tax=Apostasia shenzhenica TaxID=1088818 RepID=A0A2I0AD58_9ASPA|nr:hypothetical protein AXF42_Ash020907 [Apostasia shenzhenica]